MFLDHLRLTELTEDHMTRLLIDGITESREIDYKQDVIGDGDSARKEFLKDISAFANTLGGYLLIGIEERQGVPVSISGVILDDPDKEKQKLQNLLRDCIQPRLAECELHAVPLEAIGRYVIIIRIGRSWNPPHRISYKGKTAFYTRTSSGAEEMDVGQLRSSFLTGAALGEKLERFRTTRLLKIKSDETLLATDKMYKGTAVLHIFALGGGEVSANIKEMMQNERHFRPFLEGGMSPRYNVDGLMIRVTRGETDGRCGAYTQVFRNGIIETVSGDLVYTRLDRPGANFLRINTIADALVQRLPSYIVGLRSLGFGPPYVIMLSFLNIKGSKIEQDMHFTSEEVDRNDLELSNIVVEREELSGKWEIVIRPLLDDLSNAYGLDSSFHFNRAGEFVRRSI